MMQRYLKKILPTEKKLEQDAALFRIRGHLVTPLIWSINRRSISKGVAIGLLIAFVPLPIQMLLAALLAIFFNANLPVAVALTWITNPITFIPINFFIYKVGNWLSGGLSTHYTIYTFEFAGSSIKGIAQHFLQWLQGISTAFLIGLPIVAISVSLLGFLMTRLIWRLAVYWQWRHRKRSK